jgi:diguanylate cyclase (GGDEF)-like protein
VAAPASAKLPSDLAEFLARPAVMAPKLEAVGWTSNESETVDNPPAAEPEQGGSNVLARLVDTPRGDATSQSALDPLTGLEGPSSWGRIVEIENARLLRYRRPVTVVMAEVEGLRRLTERLGEEPVDRLLPVIADTLRREARSSDWVARVGPGRFAAFLPETDEIQAINYVERIRIVCEPWLGSAAVPLRLAIGWSSPGASTDLEHAIGQAEARMHDDRRMHGKPIQPHAGPARVVSLSAGSLATEGLADLTEASVAPAETGRPALRDDESVAFPAGVADPGMEPAHTRSWPHPDPAAGG